MKVQIFAICPSFWRGGGGLGIKFETLAYLSVKRFVSGYLVGAVKARHDLLINT